MPFFSFIIIIITIKTHGIPISAGNRKDRKIFFNDPHFLKIVFVILDRGIKKDKEKTSETKLKRTVQIRIQICASAHRKEENTMMVLAFLFCLVLSVGLEIVREKAE